MTSPSESAAAYLQLGAKYYNSAMELQRPEDRAERIMRFRTAEMLYLLALSWREFFAFQNLGYLYSYDRCEGETYFIEFPLQGMQVPYEPKHSNERLDKNISTFGNNTFAVHLADLVCPEVEAQGIRFKPGDQWDRVMHMAHEAGLTPFNHDAWAFTCFDQGAMMGYPESVYKKGDLLLRGQGCEADRDQALDCYRRAFELSRGGEPIVWGSAAIRLAQCAEEDAFDEEGFAEALHWYQVAESGLGIGVNQGEWFYEKQLARAVQGAKRMRQYLDQEY